MEWLSFDLQADYNKNLIKVSLVKNTKPSDNPWVKKDTLLTKDVVISGFFKSPKGLVDRVVSVQVEMIKWYSKNRKLVDAIDMLVVNGNHTRIRVQDIDKIGFLEKIIRHNKV